MVHECWTPIFNKLRKEAGLDFPGYLTHESCNWSDIHKSWFFLPRKSSSEGYDPDLDESRCANILIKV